MPVGRGIGEHVVKVDGTGKESPSGREIYVPDLVGIEQSAEAIEEFWIVVARSTRFTEVATKLPVRAPIVGCE